MTAAEIRAYNQGVADLAAIAAQAAHTFRYRAGFGQPLRYERVAEALAAVAEEGRALVRSTLEPSA